MAESRHGKHQDGNLLVGPGKGRQSSKKGSSGSGKDDSDGEGGLLIIQKGELWRSFMACTCMWPVA
jgi:hypothetical protein